MAKKRQVLKSMLRHKNSLLAITVLLALTKMLGFLKYPFIAGYFETSRDLDIFWTAYLLPDTLFAILIAGSVNAAVIPVFTGVLHNQGARKLARLYIVSMVTVFLAVFGISLLGVFYAQQIAQFVADVVSTQSSVVASQSSSFLPGEVALLANLIRIMMFSTLFLSLSALTTAYLQVYEKFFITNIAPLAYNIGMLLGMLYFVAYKDFGVIGLAWAALLGSILHFSSQIWQAVEILRSKCTVGKNGLETFLGGLKGLRDSLTQLRVMLRLSLPRMLAYALEYVNTSVITAVSLTLRHGTLSAYKYAYSIHLLPAQIFGSAIGQVALPEMSTDFARKNFERYKESFNSAVLHTLFLIIPIAMWLFVLRMPIVRLILGYKNFGWEATQLTAWALGLFVFAIVAEAVIGMVMRGLYAIHNTRIPLLVAFLSVFVNLALVIYLTNAFSHFTSITAAISTVSDHYMLVGKEITLGEANRWLISTIKDILTVRNDSPASVGGLALAFSGTYVFEMILLTVLFNKYAKVMNWHATYMPVIKIVLSALISTIALRLTLGALERLWSIDTVFELGVTIVASSLIGLLVYILMSRAFKVSAANRYFEFIKKLKSYR